MTQGLRTWRTLGAGFALIVGTLSGCTTPEKKPFNPYQNRQVGPPSAGGLPGQITPPNGRTPMPTGGAPSVQPGVAPGATSTSFGSMMQNPLNAGIAPAPGWQPPMSAPTQPINPASFQPAVAPVTAHPSAGFQSQGHADVNAQMAMSVPPSTMGGATMIPASAHRLPPGPTMEMADLTPPQPPTGHPGTVLPPGDFSPIAPVRP